MAAATKTRTLQVVCPKCHDEDATVSLNLNDLPTCECLGCNEQFTPAEAALMFSRMAEKWARVAAWVDAAPTV